MAKTIIGFTGKKRSGKTEASQALLELGFRPIHFKTPLLDEVKKNFKNLLAFFEHLYEMDIDDLFKYKPDGIRKLLQNYGTDVRRGDNRGYWIKQWRKTAKVTVKNVVVDDIRFLNEALAVKKLGGIVIKINSEGVDTEDTHISELEMDYVIPDYTIENNGSIQDLRDKVLAIYEEQNKVQ